MTRLGKIGPVILEVGDDSIAADGSFYFFCVLLDFTRVQEMRCGATYCLRHATNSHFETFVIQLCSKFLESATKRLCAASFSNQQPKDWTIFPVRGVLDALVTSRNQGHRSDACLTSKLRSGSCLLACGPYHYSLHAVCSSSVLFVHIDNAAFIGCATACAMSTVPTGSAFGFLFATLLVSVHGINYRCLLMCPDALFFAKA
eukprot:5894419-Amphidinium_carterae.1